MQIPLAHDAANLRSILNANQTARGSPWATPGRPWPEMERRQCNQRIHLRRWPIAAPRSPPQDRPGGNQSRSPRSDKSRLCSRRLKAGQLDIFRQCFSFRDIPLSHAQHAEAITIQPAPRDMLCTTWQLSRPGASRKGFLWLQQFAQLLELRRRRRHCPECHPGGPNFRLSSASCPYFSQPGHAGPMWPMCPQKHCHWLGKMRRVPMLLLTLAKDFLLQPFALSSGLKLLHCLSQATTPRMRRRVHLQGQALRHWHALADTGMEKHCRIACVRLSRGRPHLCTQPRRPLHHGVFSHGEKRERLHLHALLLICFPIAQRRQDRAIVPHFELGARRVLWPVV